MTGVFYCDTEGEKFEMLDELEGNPDFTYLGYFDMVQDVYHELNEYGFSDEEVEKMSLSRYGRVVEIIEYLDHYDAFIGVR